MRAEAARPVEPQWGHLYYYSMAGGLRARCPRCNAVLARLRPADGAVLLLEPAKGQRLPTFRLSGPDAADALHHAMTDGLRGSLHRAAVASDTEVEVVRGISIRCRAGCDWSTEYGGNRLRDDLAALHRTSCREAVLCDRRDPRAAIAS